MVRTYKPKEWPYLAKAARDGAAEEIAAALCQALPLAETAQDAETLRRLLRTIYHLQSALRHLESAGAQTRPANL